MQLVNGIWPGLALAWHWDYAGSNVIVEHAPATYVYLLRGWDTHTISFSFLPSTITIRLIATISAYLRQD